VKSIKFILIFIITYCFAQDIYTTKAHIFCNDFLTSNNYLSFSKFHIFREQLTEKQKLDVDLNKEIYESILKYSDLISKNEPSDSLLISYYEIFSVLNRNAEGSQIVAKNYSNYFTINLQKCLIALENINDENVINIMVNESLFMEDNSIKIINHIRNNNLSNKSYYKYYKEYF